MRALRARRSAPAMNLHEYQAKDVFRSSGFRCPPGASPALPKRPSPPPALGGPVWVVKAQVHAGGRGKAGGVKLVRDLDAVRAPPRPCSASAWSHRRPAPKACRRQGLRRSRLGDRPRAVSVAHPEPGQGAHGAHRLRCRRHGHRGSRRTRRRRKSSPSTCTRPRACSPTRPQAGFCAGLKRPADRRLPEDRGRAVSAVCGARCEPGGNQSADRHQGRHADGAGCQDQHR